MSITEKTGTKKARCLLSKLGLDKHDRGITLVANALRDAGVEVIYLGGDYQNAEGIVKAAIEEDVHVIGVSSLCGGYVIFVPEILNLLEARKVKIPLIVGGTIDMAHVDWLKSLGVKAVFVSDASLGEIVDCVRLLSHNDEDRATQYSE